MALPKPITIRIRSQTHIPELENCPADDANAIVQRCITSKEMEQLSRQHMFQFRVVIGCLFAGMCLLLLLMRCRYPRAVWSFVPVMAIALLSLPGHLVVHHIRTGRLLRRLILQELAARDDS
jgi:hypothetical protein